MRGRKRCDTKIDKAKVKALAKENDLQLQEVAMLAYIVPKTLSYTLRRGTCYLDIAQQIADVLGVTVEDLS